MGEIRVELVIILVSILSLYMHIYPPIKSYIRHLSQSPIKSYLHSLMNSLAISVLLWSGFFVFLGVCIHSLITFKPIKFTHPERDERHFKPTPHRQDKAKLMVTMAMWHDCSTHQQENPNFMWFSPLCNFMFHDGKTNLINSVILSFFYFNYPFLKHTRYQISFEKYSLFHSLSYSSHEDLSLALQQFFQNDKSCISSSMLPCIYIYF